MINLNNAGSSFIPTSVHKKNLYYIKLEQELSGYYFANKFHKESIEVYSNIAKLINSKETEIALVQSASVGWQRIVLSMMLQSGDEVLIDSNEYGSNYLFLLKLKKERNIKIIFIDSSASGEVCITDLKKKITSKTKLICLTHIASSNGMVNNVDAVGRLARKHNVPFLLDACQSIGHIPIDVQKIKCDFLCTSSRKFLRGPRGTGFIYIRISQLPNLNPQLMDFQSIQSSDKDTFTKLENAKVFETWERSITNQLCLNESIKFLLNRGNEKTFLLTHKKSEYLRNKLQEIDAVNLQDQGKRKSAIITFTTSKIDHQLVLEKLRKAGILISLGKQEFARLDLQGKNLKSILRVSPHYYNTKKEMNLFIQELKNILI